MSVLLGSAALSPIRRNKCLTPPQHLNVVRPFQHAGDLFWNVPSPSIVLPRQCWVATVDLGHEYVLDDLVRIRSVRLPPFVYNRVTVSEVYGTDLCRCKTRLFQNLSRGTLKESLSFLGRPGYALPECSQLRDPMQEQILATGFLLSEQKDTDLNRQPKLSHALLSIADPSLKP